MKRTLLVWPALMGLATLPLAGCGSGGGGDGGRPIVVGTTDTIQLSKDDPAPFDPATGYDIESWNVFNNTYQTLLRLPRSGTEPEPEAAQECHFADTAGEQYRCTLRKGLTFSNGDRITSADVKFSVDRMIRINDPNGPASLLSNLDKVETPDDSTVVFHLSGPDSTFPFKLATPAADIVDKREYGATKLHTGTSVVGSGPYTLDSFTPGKSAVFTRNSRYKGSLKINNGKIEVRFFDSSAAMLQALKGGSIDVMSRTMSPAQINTLADGADPQIKITEAPGTEIRYLVFNTADPTVKNPAVRKAIAELVDRQSLTHDVYQRTTTPLYSLVPQGITGHTNAFFDAYGDEPDLATARRTLQRAGVDTPVPLTLSYTTTHYGEATAPEFTLLREQLESGGLFRVTLKGIADWSAYKASYRARRLQVFGMGWFPDFPDPDNYVAPFFGRDDFLNLAYSNPEIRDQIIPATRQKTARSGAIPAFEQAQQDIARDVPVLPLWQGKQYLAARSDITGTEWALNASSTTQFWELGRGVPTN
ncbi:ABC transporter substrate-binding protein [Actinacidiphila rubida]|uniref:Peptide/nickel transport system substrate-binding protein n=1 Tax=Actinacidiphila rubida TaxID=310780 RepID=A0A1H8RL13_9ACTN|nr:ABC transporter substrate-binding protein [Actinacidiphila rubida]SEO66854.1 peptide/nickel transport system substrate-binding protein [Actinacidiphila rubida]